MPQAGGGREGTLPARSVSIQEQRSADAPHGATAPQARMCDAGARMCDVWARMCEEFDKNHLLMVFFCIICRKTEDRFPRHTHGMPGIA
jgi:hypothetical protein